MVVVVVVVVVVVTVEVNVVVVVFANVVVVVIFASSSQLCVDTPLAPTDTALPAYGRPAHMYCDEEASNIIAVHPDVVLHCRRHSQIK